jgi:hypothetical protein
MALEGATPLVLSVQNTVLFRASWLPFGKLARTVKTSVLMLLCHWQAEAGQLPRVEHQQPRLVLVLPLDEHCEQQ